MPPACERSGCTTATPVVQRRRGSPTGSTAARRSPAGPACSSTRRARSRACSGRSGLLDEQRSSGSSSGSSRRAIAVDMRPWKSTTTSRSGPSASRTAATRSTTAWVAGRRVDRCHAPGCVHLDGGEAGLDLLAAPASATSLRLVAADPGVDPHPVAHRAAEQPRAPARRKPCPRCPTGPGRCRRRRETAPGRRGRSRPWSAPASGPRCAAGPRRSAGRSSSSTAVRTVSARPSTTGSPHPMIPSSVSIRRNSHRGATRKVLDVSDLHSASRSPGSA